MANEIDLPQARLHEVSPNELGFDQKLGPDGTSQWDDPVKFRFGAARPADGRTHQYLGCISMDLLSNGSRREKGFIAFKLDNNDGEPAIPCIEIYMGRDLHADSDADMLCVCRISSKGIELDPKGAGGMAITGVAASAGRVSRFYTDDGRYCYNFQGPASGQPQGSGIKYDTHDSPDESTWTAISRVMEAPL